MAENTLLYVSALPGLGYPGEPIFGGHAAREAAKRDVESAAALYGVPDLIASLPDRASDLEEFWENVARAAAAYEAAAATGQTIKAHEGHDWTAEEITRRLGPVSTIEEDGHAVDPLLAHPLLRAYGGRWMHLAGYSSEPGEIEPEHHLVDLILSRARAGVARVVVKLAGRKHGIFIVPLTADMTADDVHSAIYDNFDDGWTLVRLDGLRDQFLVQDWIDMQYEYRLFVVDGKIITGAGCIEEFTPYSVRSDAQSFDTRVRRLRENEVMRGDDEEPLADLPHLVRMYLEFAKPIAEQYGGTVTIDVATDVGTGRPVVVELNTLPNSGLYASNPHAMYRALATANDRGYGTYAFRDTGA